MSSDDLLWNFLSWLFVNVEETYGDNLVIPISSVVSFINSLRGNEDEN